MMAASPQFSSRAERSPSTPWLVPPAGHRSLRRAASALRHGPAALLLALIAIYQRFFSPVLPVVTLGACACRFTPTCSHYAAEAVRCHGVLRGTALAVMRLLKCTPLHAGGFDPVPPRRARPVCRSSLGS